MKPFAKYFSPNEVLAKEGLSDRTVALLCEQLESRFMEDENAGKVVDLAQWIEFCKYPMIKALIGCLY
jgi:hypothetical protein